MQIILQDGHFDGQRLEIEERAREVTQEGNIYKILAGWFIDGRQVFRFDERATLERRHGKPKRPPGMPTGSLTGYQPEA